MQCLLLRAFPQHYIFCRNKGGSVVSVNLTTSMMRKADGSPDYFISVIEDISARKRVEDKLRDSEERLRLATSAAGVGVLERDAHTDSTIWENDRMYEIFGHTRANGAISKAQFIERYLHPDDATMLEQALDGAMESGRPFHTVVRIRRRESALSWLYFAGSFEIAGDGAPIRMIGEMADITERKQAEAEREQLAKE
jgi:PAS domain S-box-containing protein